MPLSTIADTDDATFERLIHVKLKGTFNTLREAAWRLREGRPTSRSWWVWACRRR